jgi:DNA-directed RNA polymerase specialized sigma24 family protein
MGPKTRIGVDPAEAVARIAANRRDRLLRVNRRRLRWEDLEDCYSQATLELIARSRDRPFATTEHVLHALEQRFTSRIDDRRRAIGGRSPIEAALASALPVNTSDATTEIEDRRAEVLSTVAGRFELRRLREVLRELSPDQRLVLGCQVSLELSSGEFCDRYGWSPEKYRKVAQRARAKLRILVTEYASGERCRRLEPELLAYAAGVATPAEHQRAQLHLRNCTACARSMSELERAGEQIAAFVPLPGAPQIGLVAKLTAAVVATRRAIQSLAPGAETPATGGSALGIGAAKLAAVCLVGAAAGGYAVCDGGLIGSHARLHHAPHAHVARPRPRPRAVVSHTFFASPPRTTTVASTATTARRRTASHPRIYAPRGSEAVAQAQSEFGPATTSAPQTASVSRDASVASTARASPPSAPPSGAGEFGGP